MSSTDKSRRQFLKSAGLGLGVGALTPQILQASAPSFFRKAEKKLGVALVGLGYYATHKIRPALLETDYCELKGIVTGTPAKEQEWIDKYGVERKHIYNYENFDRIGDNADIDIVYVVLPNAMHADYIIRAARAGKHVICEKPFDTTVKKSAAAVDYCHKMGKLLQIGYRCQYDPVHQEFMRIGREKDLGALKSIRSAHSFYGVHNDNWRFTNKALAGGGPLMDVGVYSIQAARYGTGLEPVAVSARTFNTFPNLMDGMEETMTFSLEFPGDVVANITTSYAARGNFIEVSAEQGNYGLGPAFGYDGAELNIKGEKKSLPKINQQAAQMDAFARNILDNTPVVADGEDGLQDMRIVEALYKSARKNGKRIKLS